MIKVSPAFPKAVGPGQSPGRSPQRAKYPGEAVARRGKPGLNGGEVESVGRAQKKAFREKSGFDRASGRVRYYPSARGLQASLPEGFARRQTAVLISLFPRREGTYILIRIFNSEIISFPFRSEFAILDIELPITP